MKLEGWIAYDGASNEWIASNNRDDVVNHNGIMEWIKEEFVVVEPITIDIPDEAKGAKE